MSLQSGPELRADCGAAAVTEGSGHFRAGGATVASITAAPEPSAAAISELPEVGTGGVSCGPTARRPLSESTRPETTPEEPGGL